MKTRSLVAATLFAACVSSLGALGCHHREPAKGPAEKAGEKLDNAAEKTKDVTKDTVNDVKRKTD